MSYNGSGTFVVNSTGQPVVTGTVISSTAFNALTADLATGLSTAITKDGQTTTTARIVFAQGVSSTLVTDATSATTGSIITAGGISTQKALWVGTTSNFAGAMTAAGATFSGNVSASNYFSAASAFRVGYSASYAFMDIYGSAGDILTFGITGAEKMRLNSTGLGIGVASPACILDISGASGGQIKFPATMNASSNANTLDDYEEGAWTPTFTSTGATFTYGTRYASYTKIGDLVTLMVYMQLSGVSGTTTNPILLSGFPFTTIGGTFSSSGVFGVEQFTVRPTFFTETSVTTANIYQAGTVSAMTAIMANAGFYLYALTYQTA